LTDKRATSLPPRTFSKSVTRPDGKPAIKIEALSVPEVSILRLAFEGVNSEWRQGVFLATDGVLTIDGIGASRLVIWADSAPAELEIDVSSKNGSVIIYNVWDSGRGRGPFESQSATSGMLVDKLENGVLRFSCTDIGIVPDFNKLVFRVSIESGMPDRR
jgi:hypothetical protein